jgi:hypothetical protein
MKKVKVNKNKNKTQIGGDHYEKVTLQPIDYIFANDLGFAEGNIVKYVTRYKDKNGKEDLEKIIQYAEMLIEEHYGHE